ncbi:MAG: hypothetical protein OQK04_00385 [Kangiellaceae bacterium]|nr:hypothetical protein [Kangiellaceae bacterium]MCW8997157.1 hypothetical protein [Kangiellaceae bacterium]
MARNQKNEALRQEMCRRLRLLAEKHLEIERKQLSESLGYKNDTVLRRVWKGEVFPDTERLAKLAKLKTENGGSPNIHWIIAGEGTPLLFEADRDPSTQSRLIDVLSRLPVSKTKSLLSFLEQ